MLTGYDVAYKKVSATNSDRWLTVHADSASTNSVSVDNLTLFETYKFKVRTVNSVGVSGYSQPVTLYTELGLSAHGFVVTYVEIFFIVLMGMTYKNSLQGTLWHFNCAEAIQGKMK